jgi:hypothetical protein
MLFVFFLAMLRTYAHEREVCWKMLHFYHSYVTCLYGPFYLIGDACIEYVDVLLVLSHFYHVVVFFFYLRSTCLHL